MAENNGGSSNNRLRIIIGIVVVLVVLVGGAYAGFIVLSGTGEASVDVGAEVEGVAQTDRSTRYIIDSEQSEARYLIDEILNGEDFTVVGTTNDVAGEILVNSGNPSASEIGQILINARTFVTESNMRDRALRSFILLSAQDEYELITFQPTAVEGLPEERIEAGTELEFQIIGDITVIETTTSVTFDTTATVTEDGTLTGLATLTIAYADLGVDIPRLPPQVASVDENVTLEIDFVAVEASEAETTDAEATAETTDGA